MSDLPHPDPPSLPVSETHPPEPTPAEAAEADGEATRLRQELSEIIAPGDAKCAICQATRRRHKQLEEAGELHHRFSTAGELVHSTPPPAPKRVQAAPDLVLRMALLNRGLITAEDLIRAEMMLRDTPASSATASPAAQPGVPPVSGGPGRPD